MGTTLGRPLVARVRDRFNNPVPGVNVTFTADGGTMQPATAVTDAAGRARASWTLPTSSGWKEAFATVSGLTPAGFTALAKPGPTTQMIFDPTTLNAPPNSRVEVRIYRGDAFGNQTGTMVEYPSATSSAPAVASFVGVGGSTVLIIQTGSPGDATLTITEGGFTGTLPVHVAAP